MADSILMLSAYNTYAENILHILFCVNQDVAWKVSSACYNDGNLIGNK